MLFLSSVGSSRTFSPRVFLIAMATLRSSRICLPSGVWASLASPSLAFKALESCFSSGCLRGRGPAALVVSPSKPVKGLKSMPLPTSVTSAAGSTTWVTRARAPCDLATEPILSSITSQESASPSRFPSFSVFFFGVFRLAFFLSFEASRSLGACPPSALRIARNDATLSCNLLRRASSAGFVVGPCASRLAFAGLAFTFELRLFFLDAVEFDGTC
mmetsp:Transcript_6032/g.11846  ORF Transcript_6032/g.11846 Transcript_6032/m.11846 type:complete len:216 (-) Transcript_6032:385-1032(-)